MSVKARADFRQQLAELRRSTVKNGDKDKLRAGIAEVLRKQSHYTSRKKGQRQTDANVDLVLTGKDSKTMLKMKHKTLPRTDLEYDWQMQCDAVYIANQVLKAAGKGGVRRNSKSFKKLNLLSRELQKAFSTGGSGTGAEFIPSDLSASLIEEVRLELKVAAMHPRIQMPTDPFKMPLEGADVDAHLVAEQTSDNTSTEANKIPAETPGTKDITFNAKKLAVRSVWSEEVDQDSIVPVQEYLRKKLARALADAQEDATINGDTAGTHQDNDVTSATDRRKAWDGYRKLALSAAKKDASNVVPSLQLIRDVRRQLGKFGVNPANLAWVTGIQSFHRLMEIDEVQTLDKLGPQAVILTGQLAAIDGIPVIVSEFVREDVNASGVFDNSVTDRTTMNLVYNDGFLYGDRLNVTMKSAENIETDQILMVTKQRLDFKVSQDAAIDKVVGTLFNLAL